jgi:hypothetical protein
MHNDLRLHRIVAECVGIHDLRLHNAVAERVGLDDPEAAHFISRVVSLDETLLDDLVAGRVNFDYRLTNQGVGEDGRERRDDSENEKPPATVLLAALNMVCTPELAALASGFHSTEAFASEGGGFKKSIPHADTSPRRRPGFTLR